MRQMPFLRLVLAFLTCLILNATHTAQACEVSNDEVQVGTGTMPYISAGKGASILLIHGLFAQKEQWQQVVCTLADAGYQAVAPDLPGYGQTRGYDLSVYPLEAQVDLLGEFSDKIGIRPQHVAGNSMGGAIAALYARAHTDEVHSLAFIGGALGIAPWAEPIKASILAGSNPFIPQTPAQLEAELAMLLTHPPKLSADAQTALLAPYQQNTHHYVQVWNIVNLYSRILADGPGGRLPTLILWGDEDRVFAIADSQALAQQYPRHRRQTLPQTGHLAMLDSPTAVSRAYIEFIKHTHY